MNNFLCSVLLVLSMSECSVAQNDDVCVNNPDIPNAMINQDEQCDGTVITCQDGYEMTQGIECKDDEWEYQQPICQIKREIVQCTSVPEITNGTIDNDVTSGVTGDAYKFTCNTPFLKNGIEGEVICSPTGEWEANLTCEDCYTKQIITSDFDVDCSSCLPEDGCGYHVIGGQCRRYPLPVIFQSDQFTLVQCIQQCKDMEQCVTMGHYASESECILFNVNVDSMPNTVYVTPSSEADDKVLEKSTCPTIFE